MKIAKIIIPLMLIFLLVACVTDKKVNYVGNWKMDAGSSNIELVLNDDMTFVLSDNEGSLGGSYEINENMIVFSVNEVEETNPVNENIKAGDTIECTIELKDDVLSISYDDDEYIFTKG